MFQFLPSMMAGGSAAAGGAGAGVAGGAAGGADAGGGWGALFSNPNFLSFLAGTGANLDPEGVGGAVGRSTQAWIQNEQMGKAMAKQDQRWEALIEALSKGKVGSASIRTDGKGMTSVSLKAPGDGLGALDQQTPQQQQQQSPFQQYMDGMNKWFQKFGQPGV